MRWRWDSSLPDEAAIKGMVAPYAEKLLWFYQRGYGRHKPKGGRELVTPGPHLHQLMFHCASDPATGLLCSSRSLIAGRRGGKTLGVGWDVAAYIENPHWFHQHVHGEEDDRPLHGWVISKDNVVNRAALYMLRSINGVAGLNWNENRTLQLFEAPNGSLIEMKTAVDPESLRGMGLDFIWWDEACFIPERRAYDVASPALDDHEGIEMFSSTPDGKNWFWEEKFSDEALADPTQAQIEYRSIDNPYFPKARWLRRKATYHPMLFKQEYEASFDSFAGKELPGEYLARHFYVLGKNEEGGWDIPRVDGAESKMDVTTYMGVDPASSLADTADYFAMALWAVAKQTGVAYLLDTYRGRLPFAEQLDVIREWHLRYRPRLIGVEAVAYQRVLAQQAARGIHLPPIVEMPAPGKKQERILAMAPLFKVGRCRVRATQRDFIDEWLGYDTKLKNPRDDLLDAAEIGLRVAGALLELHQEQSLYDPLDLPAGSADELAQRDLPGNHTREPAADEWLGAEW